MARMPVTENALCGSAEFNHRSLEAIAARLNEKYEFSIGFSGDIIFKLDVGLATCIGIQDTEDRRLDTKVVVAQISKIVNAIECLQTALKKKEGFVEDRVALEAHLQIVQSLVSEGYARDIAEAWDRIETALQSLLPVQIASKHAEVRISDIKGTPGRPSNDAYDEFVYLMEWVADQFDMSKAVSTDRMRNKKIGEFIDLVLGFEQFLPEKLRSSGRNSCAKKIERARKRPDKEKRCGSLRGSMDTVTNPFSAKS